MSASHLLCASHLLFASRVMSLSRFSFIMVALALTGPVGVRAAQADLSGGWQGNKGASTPRFVTIVPVVSKRAKTATFSEDSPSELSGRYAVMREKRDTGCMITLDGKSRVKGGERAQLAPGCRDQGIVIFDPAAWMVVKGELVLTARAGHKAHLLKSGEGLWQKDPKEGGKPLGLKKL